MRPEAPPTDLTLALASARSQLVAFGTAVHYYPVAGSTNDIAGRLAVDGAAEGTIVVADAQTAGRGRNGRTWFSPPGAGLYVSVVLRPVGQRDEGSGAPPWVRLVTVAAGVAIAQGVQAATGLPVEVKWPNDIVVSDRLAPTAAGRRWRKLAGVLAEGQTAGGILQHIIVGYGINLKPAAYPHEIADRASSLEAEAGRVVQRTPVLVQTLIALRREYEGLQRGEAALTLRRWRQLSPSGSGARVCWEHAGSRVEGVTAGIDDQGALLVRHDGATLSVSAGEVVWL